MNRTLLLTAMLSSSLLFGRSGTPRTASWLADCSSYGEGLRILAAPSGTIMTVHAGGASPHLFKSKLTIPKNGTFQWEFFNGGGGWLKVTRDPSAPYRGAGTYLQKIGEPVLRLDCTLLD